MPWNPIETSRPRSLFSGWSTIGWLVCIILSLTSQPLLGLSLFVLLAGWHFLSRVHGPPVVVAAFTYQWLQVTVAIFYFALTGREIIEMQRSHYQPMLMIGLASIAAYFGGYYWVSRDRRQSQTTNSAAAERSDLTLIGTGYAVTLVLSIALQRIAFSIPVLTQFLFFLGFARYALLFVLMMRLLKPNPRWTLIIFVLVLELAIGFAGFFASFRESLVFIGLAIVASGGFRRPGTWVATALVAVIAFTAAVTWTVIKPEVRKEFSSSASTTDRLRNVAGVIGPTLTSSSIAWGPHVDKLVSRLWQVYFPSLAYARVPSSIPFENGQILKRAVTNTLMPRILFPDKGEIVSESELVRKYTGVHVAGRDRQTSFAFGYVAESYVDFGWPLMFLPIFAFGCIVGFGDRLIKRVLKNDDVLQGVRIVVLWSTMYLYETSWTIMIGTFTSLMIALVGGAWLFERLYKAKPRRERVDELPEEFLVAARLRAEARQKGLPSGGRIPTG